MKRHYLAGVLGGLSIALMSCIELDGPEPAQRAEAPTAVAPGNDAKELLVPSPWTDSAGDVSLPNADMIAGTVVVGDGTVELRVQFTAPPFPSTATHHVDWCIDLDQNPGTGTHCGAGELIGADAAVSCRSTPNRPLDLFVLRPGLPAVPLDPAQHLVVDSDTNTLHICFPDSLLLADTQFSYVVGSIFGGSFGANDWAPNHPGFGEPTTAFVNEIGAPSCCPSSSAVCREVGIRVDAECPCDSAWRNHGEYVSCVARATTRALTQWRECFDESELDQITGCVVAPRARSQCGRIRPGSGRAGIPAGERPAGSR